MGNKSGENKSKKRFSILSVVVFGIICFCMGWGGSTILHKPARTPEIISTPYSFDVFSSVSFDGAEKTDDNPWGYTAGIFDMDLGECIFLTPNTSVNLCGDNMPSTWTFQYRIHPWVETQSDGAGLIIWILDEEENIIHSEEIPIVAENQWQDFSLDIGAYDLADKIKIMCNNGSADNDECDWVILRAQSVKSVPFADHYVRSATYFADEWSINFWNCEMDHLSSDLAQIKEDGFDSIIIVIPWREFQPTVSPVSYNDYAFSKLDDVMSAADNVELKVYARLGYTWDFYRDENENIIDRFYNLLGDDDTLAAWDDYIEKMHQALSVHNSFAEAFLTWEDLWGSTAVCDMEDFNDRIAISHFVRYGEWVSRHYTLEQYNQDFQTNYTDYDQIPIPHRSEPALWAMYEFYDEFLIGILERSQQYFPNLSMEVRMDWDLVTDAQGNPIYYKHSSLYSCADSDFSTTMYGIPMGFENVGETVSYEEALKQTEYTLEKFMFETGGKAVYIDQFIFADNTPNFSQNAKIKEEELDDYLLNVADVLKKYSDGYGIWTYRDYCSNMLYNPQFVLEDEGWDSQGATFMEINGSKACRIAPATSLGQTIPLIRDHFKANQYSLVFDVVELPQSGTVKIQLGDNALEINLTQTGQIQLTFERPSYFDLKISSTDADLIIDNIKLYSQIQKGYLYDESFEELECIDAIRALNRMLFETE